MASVGVLLLKLSVQSFKHSMSWVMQDRLSWKPCWLQWMVLFFPMNDCRWSFPWVWRPGWWMKLDGNFLVWSTTLVVQWVHVSISTVVWECWGLHTPSGLVALPGFSFCRFLASISLLKLMSLRVSFASDFRRGKLASNEGSSARSDAKYLLRTPDFLVSSMLVSPFASWLSIFNDVLVKWQV